MFKARSGLLILAIAFLLLVAASSLRADAGIAGLGNRFVDGTSGVDAGDCTLQSAPCATIPYAVSQADPYDGIVIAPGTYVEPVTIATVGLQLLPADPADRPILTRTSGSTNQPLLVIDDVGDVLISGLRFDMDQTYVAEGILASGFVDGLAVQDNEFHASHSGGPTSTFGLRNAISINVVPNSMGLPRVNGSTVLIENNLVNGLLPPPAPSLRSGISMDAGLGAIRGNDITTTTQDITVRFATVTGASTSDSIEISGNQLKGRGLQFADANAGVSGVLISDNVFQAVPGIDDLTVFPADWSLVRLIHNIHPIPVTISGNHFLGHQGSYRGLLLQNFPGVLLDGNFFAPAAGASDFTSVAVSNKELVTVDPPRAPLPLALTARNNVFQDSGIAGAGRAFEFINDNDAGGSADFAALIVGSPGANNEFHCDH